uniref:Uncharacterized protein n=1 Tax=Peronospora matthiolae TaxID=2874970 RepID=A0AAV1UUV4_9STRA
MFQAGRMHVCMDMHVLMASGQDDVGLTRAEYLEMGSMPTARVATRLKTRPRIPIERQTWTFKFDSRRRMDASQATKSIDKVRAQALQHQ